MTTGWGVRSYSHFRKAAHSAGGKSQKRTLRLFRFPFTSHAIDSVCRSCSCVGDSVSPSSFSLVCRLLLIFDSESSWSCRSMISAENMEMVSISQSDSPDDTFSAGHSCLEMFSVSIGGFIPQSTKGSALYCVDVGDPFGVKRDAAADCQRCGTLLDEEIAQHNQVIEGQRSLTSQGSWEGPPVPHL